MRFRADAQQAQSQRRHDEIRAELPTSPICRVSMSLDTFSPAMEIGPGGA